MSIRSTEDRQRDLEALNFLNPWECDRHSIPDRENAVRRLDALCRSLVVAIRTEPGKPFDHERHDAVVAALKAEKSELAAIRRIDRRKAAAPENIKLFDSTRDIRFLSQFEELATRQQLASD